MKTEIDRNKPWQCTISWYLVGHSVAPVITIQVALNVTLNTSPYDQLLTMPYYNRLCRRLKLSELSCTDWKLARRI